MGQIADRRWGYFLFALLFSAGLMLWLLKDAYFGFTGYSFFYILCSFILVLVLEFSAAFFLIRRKIPELVFVIVNAGIVVANYVYVLVPVLHIDFSVKLWLLFLVCGLTLVLPWTVSGRKFGIGFCVIFLLMCIGGIARNLILAQNVVSTVSRARVSSAVLPARNVYLIGLDALPDAGFYEQDFGREAFWVKNFESLGFRTVLNAKTDGEPRTIGTYKSMFAMRPLKGGALASIGFSDYMPALELKDKLGYKLQFMFHDNFFGKAPSAAFDYYYPLHPVGLCPFLPEHFNFFPCRPVVKTFFSNLFGFPDEIEELKRQYLSRVESLSTASDKWVSIVHFWMPGHALGWYRDDDLNVRASFAVTYQENLHRADELIADVVGRIKKFDRDPVIIIYGDHGPWRSQNYDVESGVRKIFDADRLYSDRNRVGLFVYPAASCPEFRNGYELSALLKDAQACGLKKKN